MTNIFYTDSLDQRITKNERGDRYNKVFTENEVVQRIESYHQDALEDITYFLSENEQQGIVLSHLSQKATRFIILNRREKFGKYTVLKSKQFSSGKVTSKSQELFDENNLLICYQDLDPITETPILLKTEKDLHDENGETIAHFDYDADGQLRDLWGLIVHDACIYEHLNKSQPMETITGNDSINEHFPTLLSENPYYKDATFLPDLH